MPFASRLLAFRALIALLLATIGLQAVPAHSVGVERHRGSAFDIAAVEVATAPLLASTDQREVRLVEPEPRLPPVPIRLLVPLAAPEGPAASPGPTGCPPPPAPPTFAMACLAIAPRAPPLA